MYLKVTQQASSVLSPRTKIAQRVQRIFHFQILSTQLLKSSNVLPIRVFINPVSDDIENY